MFLVRETNSYVSIAHNCSFFSRPYLYDSSSSYKNSYLKSTPIRSDQGTPKASSRLIPVWLQFVFFLAVAVFLYVVFSNMETNESIKGIE